MPRLTSLTSTVITTGIYQLLPLQSSHKHSPRDEHHWTISQTESMSFPYPTASLVSPHRSHCPPPLLGRVRETHNPRFGYNNLEHSMQRRDNIYYSAHALQAHLPLR